jgi:hypothetical protein
VQGYPYNFTVQEGPSCTYTLQVQTSFSCGAVPDNATALAGPPDLSQCNYAGYNLAPLAAYDLASYVVVGGYGGPYQIHY